MSLQLIPKKEKVVPELPFLLIYDLTVFSVELQFHSLLHHHPAVYSVFLLNLSHYSCLTVPVDQKEELK